ncbi:hypothetical protein [Ruania rhizosphaerae]|uniref:hypothetical protein n=1 Tax=Ruania rhizosphaerae TaxID=1840413 RepID=UPI0013574247|nr:hypothetical protein [Ruania rhizosphaerae]
MRNKARKWVITALEEITLVMPFPVLGIDSDNGSEFINHHLLDWCQRREIILTRSRPGNSGVGPSPPNCWPGPPAMPVPSSSLSHARIR